MYDFKWELKLFSMFAQIAVVIVLTVIIKRILYTFSGQTGLQLGAGA